MARHLQHPVSESPVMSLHRAQNWLYTLALCNPCLHWMVDAPDGEHTLFILCVCRRPLPYTHEAFALHAASVPVGAFKFLTPAMHVEH